MSENMKIMGLQRPPQNPVIVSFLTEIGFSALDHDYCCTTARMGSFKFIFKKISGVLEFYSEKNV